MTVVKLLIQGGVVLRRESNYHTYVGFISINVSTYNIYIVQVKDLLLPHKTAAPIHLVTF